MDILQDPKYTSTTPFSELLHSYLERKKISRKAAKKLELKCMTIITRDGVANNVGLSEIRGTCLVSGNTTDRIALYMVNRRIYP